IDLRTFQTTGHPVYAIADGCIVRLRMVKTGSGKSLYLKHADGNTSVYFHLDRFEKNLETLVKQVQQSKGVKYFGDFYPQEPLCYKQGQVIAYSGETGYGFPHLHLEIKDPGQFSLNPFQFLELPSRDKNTPVLKGVFLRNRGASPINGEIGEFYFPFKRDKYNHYTAPRPLIITGPFDLVLNTRDITDSRRYAAPYEISAAIDEHDYFDLKFDRFSWDDNNQLGFVYDMLYSNASAFYYNLFSQEGFSLESKNIPLQGVIDSLDYGPHKLKIQVKDNYDNESTGELSIYKVKKPQLELSGCSVSGNELRFRIDKLEAEAADDVTITLKDNQERTLYTSHLNQTVISQPKEFVLKGSFAGVQVICFNFIKERIPYFKQRFLLKDQWLTSVTNIDFETFLNRDDVFIKILNPGLAPGNLRLTVAQGLDSKEVNADSSAGSIYFRFTPLNFTNKVLLNFSVYKGEEKVAEIQKPISLIYLKKGQRQEFIYEEFGAEFETRAVYEPRVLLVEEKNFHSQYPVLSKQISLSPDYFAFLDTVQFTFRKDLPNPQQVGIFKYEERLKRWSYKNTIYDSAAKTYRQTILTPGTYALLRDIFPPRVFLRKPRSQHRGALMRLDVGMTDGGKGINDDTLKVRLNGVLLDVDYDPDWRAVYIENENLKPLKIGKNVLEVEVRDYAWNKTARTFSFNLK
ncbi:MAG: Peptidoglycan DD-metalloendopeptidase family protein, partial [Acidobacteriota bacterium]|nr:Peptidoglycan DD-metalloendopeptidase family protein [Acidobacteriota bacterium]